MIFGTKNNLTVKPDLNIYVGNAKIERVSAMKYLGVILDEHLTFDEHVNYIIAKASKKLGILHRAREFLNLNTKILLYKSLVLPHMDYCDLIYMCTTEHNLQRLQYIQNCACRIILRADNYTSVKEMRQELKLPTLRQRRTIHMAMECHKNVYNPESGLQSMFIQQDITRTRRTRTTDTNTMLIPQVRSMVGRKSFAYRGPYFWNNLDRESRLLENKNSFKNHISKQICRDVNHPG